MRLSKISNNVLYSTVGYFSGLNLPNRGVLNRISNSLGNGINRVGRNLGFGEIWGPVGMTRAACFIDRQVPSIENGQRAFFGPTLTGYRFGEREFTGFRYPVLDKLRLPMSIYESLNLDNIRQRLSCVDKGLDLQEISFGLFHHGYIDQPIMDQSHVQGYSPTVTKIAMADLTMNFWPYAGSKYSAAFRPIVDDVMESGREIEIFKGYPMQTKRYLESQGYQLTQVVPHNHKSFYEMYIATDPRNKTFKYVMNILVGPRINHAETTLGIAGVRDEQVYRSRFEVSGTSDMPHVLDVVGGIGPNGIKPNILIITLRGTIVRLAKRRIIKAAYLKRIFSQLDNVVVWCGEQKRRTGAEIFDRCAKDIGATLDRFSGDGDLRVDPNGHNSVWFSSHAFHRAYLFQVEVERLKTAYSDVFNRAYANRELKDNPNPRLSDVETILSRVNTFFTRIDGIAKYSKGLPLHKKIIDLFENEKYWKDRIPSYLAAGKSADEIEVIRTEYKKVAAGLRDVFKSKMGKLSLKGKAKVFVRKHILGKSVKTEQMEQNDFLRLLGATPAEICGSQELTMALLHFNEYMQTMVDDHFVPELGEMVVFDREHLRDLQIDGQIHSLREKKFSQYFTFQTVKAKTADGREKTILMVDIPYEAMAGILVRHIASLGNLETVLYPATCGGINENLKTGDLLIPEVVSSQRFGFSDQNLMHNCMLGIRRLNVDGYAKHVSIRTPLHMTRQLLKSLREQGKDTVDVEMSHIAASVKAHNVEHPDSPIELGVFELVTDLPSETGAFGKTIGEVPERGHWHAKREDILDHFLEHLGIVEVLPAAQDPNYNITIENSTEPNTQVWKGIIRCSKGKFSFRFQNHYVPHFSQRIDQIARLLDTCADETVDQILSLIEKNDNIEITYAPKGTFTVPGKGVYEYTLYSYVQNFTLIRKQIINDLAEASSDEQQGIIDALMEQHIIIRPISEGEEI